MISDSQTEWNIKRALNTWPPLKWMLLNIFLICRNWWWALLSFSLGRIHNYTHTQAFHTISSIELVPEVQPWILGSAMNSRLRTPILCVDITNILFVRILGVYTPNSVCKHFQVKHDSYWLLPNPKFRLSDSKIYSWTKRSGIFTVFSISRKSSLEI